MGPDARHTLFIEIVFITEICKNHEAFEIITNYIARLPAGKIPEEFGFKAASTGSLTPRSKDHPKLMMALHLICSITEVYFLGFSYRFKERGKQTHHGVKRPACPPGSTSRGPFLALAQIHKRPACPPGSTSRGPFLVLAQIHKRPACPPGSTSRGLSKNKNKNKNKSKNININKNKNKNKNKN